MKVWKEILKEIGKVLVGLLPGALVCAISAALVLLDIVVFKMECDELGIVEISQSLALLTVVVTLVVAAVKRPALRGGLVLAAALFFDMLLREQDQVFELWLPHGFWVYPVIVTTAFACWYGIRRPESVRDFLVTVRANRHFPALALGFLTVIGYARLFGVKPIWQTVVGMDEFRVAKHVAEEGLELFGYVILVYWAIIFTRDLLSADDAVRKDAGRS